MPEKRYRLSPYCVFWLDPGGTTAQLVQALHGSRFEVPVELLHALVELSRGGDPAQVLARLPADAGDVLPSLLAEEVVVPFDDAALPSLPDLFRNRLNPLELAFHRGVNEGGYLPGALDGPPPPAGPSRKPGDAAIPLRLHPGPARPLDLATALRRRRSVRDFSQRPMARARLEQFLQLAARAFALREVQGMGWVSVRNYPSAGGRYPLEIYPVLHDVESLADGIYHYHPFSHCLEPLPGDATSRRLLAEMAQQRMAQATPSTPSVLLLITAVFARTCWKYRGMPYQVILMEVGALYQTMYLAAAELGLAACPIGAFPELATAELLGLDSRDEAQVGMLALGEPSEQTAPRPHVTAVRELQRSVFSAGNLGPGVELTFDDGTRHIVPLAELVLQRDGDGTASCGLAGRRPLATLDDRCWSELQRLVESRNRAPP